MAKGTKTGGGSRKGIPNRATADVRAAIATLAEANIGKVQGWLDAVARDDPARALEVFTRLLEYHIPKLARTELSGPEGEAPRTTVRIVFVDPKSATHE